MVIRFFRAAGIGSLAGAIAGLLAGGIGGRVAMRIVAIVAGPDKVGLTTENGNRVGDITVEGTLGLVLFAGVFGGILGGLIYEAVRPWLASFGRWRGLVFGLALLAAVGSVIINPGNLDFRRFGSPALNAFLFALLFILYGAVLVPIEERLRLAVPESPVRAQSVWSWIAEVAVLLALVPPGLLLAGGVAGVVSLAGRPIDESVVAPTLVVLFLVIVLALRRLLEMRERTVGGRGGLGRVGALGYAVLAVPIAVGAVESVRAIGAIVR
ncbi:MAG TPA: hypothetical protein VGR46_07960 [Candidatus Limnocylindria bacterium]|nr:hypothetical protein [Candidatus Limnocylindria bacterium]